MGKKDQFKLVGNTIAGTFRVDRLVAEGGFGVVYQAYHLHFRAPVALKCLKIPRGLSAEDRASFLEQFRSEAEIQFRLSAQLPHIVRPLHVDSVQTEGGDFVPLLALEWLEGESFEQLIGRRASSGEAPMSLTEAMKLIGPVAEALHRAHNFESAGEQLSVVHRDVKPDNLFLTEIGGEKFVKLLDFGISKMRKAAIRLAGQYSQTDGRAPFSPAYGAPEQWVPKRLGQTGPWTDVWGLALTLVEIIKGDMIISGDHQEMMGSTLDPSKRPSPRTEGVMVTDEVEAVFLKALALDPRGRYQDLRSFWEALEAANTQSGDLTRGYDTSASGTFVALPPPSPTAPWRPSGEFDLKSLKFQSPLPKMMAPAKLERTLLEDLKVESSPSFPTNPDGVLQPVLPAATSWAHFDPEVPPSSGDANDSALKQESSARIRKTARPPEAHHSLDPPLAKNRLGSEPQGTQSIHLELQPTSAFPDPASRPPEEETGSPEAIDREARPPPAPSLEPDLELEIPVVTDRKRPPALPEEETHSKVVPKVVKGGESLRPLSLIPAPGRRSSGS